MDKYIGFDIDCKKTVACVVQRGERDIYETFGPDVGSMQKFLQKQKGPGVRLEVAFEVSGEAGFIYDSLAGYADEVHVVNPVRATWIYRTAKKNDRIDARKIALLLSIGELPTVYMPGQEVREWRRVILHRSKIVGKVGQTKNRIRSTVKSQGYRKSGHGGGWWKKANRLWLQGLCEGAVDGCSLWRMQLSDLLEDLALQESQLKKVTRYLDDYLSTKAGGKLLMSIPGVGPRTAEAVLAYTDDVTRFGNYKQYCSYFGVTPKLDESGSTRRIGHINKRGPSVVRWLICESSWKVIRGSKGMRAFFDRITAGQKNRRKIAIVAVSRKLLSVMRAMLLTGELFNEALVNRCEMTNIA
jgi:transposase